MATATPREREQDKQEIMELTSEYQMPLGDDL